MKKKPTAPDGRRLAVAMLHRMQKANSTVWPDVFVSRELLRIGLASYCKMDEQGQAQFAATLNEFMASHMQGAGIVSHTIKGYASRERSSEKLSKMDPEKWKDDPAVKLARDSGVPVQTTLSILNP